MSDGSHMPERAPQPDRRLFLKVALGTGEDDSTPAFDKLDAACVEIHAFVTGLP